MKIPIDKIIVGIVGSMNYYVLSKFKVILSKNKSKYETNTN